MYSEKNIGNNVRELRIKKGMTQEVLGGIAGISGNHLGLIENSKKYPRYRTLIALCGVFNVSPNDLLTTRHKSA